MRDLLSISPRRVLALAWLAVQESLRRRVLVGFGVFLLILLFAGWFLDTKTNDPATLYLSFVLTATTYLVLLMALFLSAFSLPADIKNQDDLHDRHQAGATGRDRAGPHPRLRGRSAR